MPYRKNYNREKKAAADKRYRENNKEKNKYSVAKSYTKRFIVKMCTEDDLEEIKDLIKGREEVLNNE